MSNGARRRIAELILSHEAGDGRLSASSAAAVRGDIYRELCSVVRETEQLAKSLSKKGLAADIRRDAAWAYRSLREMNRAWAESPDGTAAEISRSAVEAVSMDFLPAVEAAARRSGPWTIRPDEKMKARTPSGLGTLSELLYKIGVYHTMYLIAIGREDKSATQDLRVAIHNSLKETELAVVSRADALRSCGLDGDADALTKDWEWVCEARDAIAKNLSHEGAQENSLDALVEAEAVPLIHNTTTPCDIPSPKGLWASIVTKETSDKAAKQAKSTACGAWDTFANGFRPGTTSVTTKDDIKLRAAGSGGGLNILEFNEVGLLHRALQCPDGTGPLEPMVHIPHSRCPGCRYAASIDTGRCPRCHERLVEAEKAHVPMRLVQRISQADPVTWASGEPLLAGATREVLLAESRRCVAVHLDKAESKAERAAGGPKKGKTLVQWLDSGQLGWIDGGEVVERQVFVYCPAEMQTTLGKAEFCFGTWVNFDILSVPNPTFRFSVGDEVELPAAKLLHYSTAVVGGTGDTDTERISELSATCTGVIVRAPGRRLTAQAEPVYDVQVGDTVLMFQKESEMRPRRGNRVYPDGNIRKMAGRCYNAFDAQKYQKYRDRR